MSGISLRVSTHLSFQRWSDCHFVPTGDSLGWLGKQLEYPRTRGEERPRPVRAPVLIPHYIQGSHVPAGRTSSPNLVLRDSTGRKSFGIATRSLSERSCLRTTHDPSMQRSRALLFSLSFSFVLLRRNTPVTWIERRSFPFVCSYEERGG